MKKDFHFLITYFKESGKLYTSELVLWSISTLADGETPYLYDAVAKLRGLRDTGGQGALPGLAGEGWRGPILIQHAKPFPGYEHETNSDYFFGAGIPHLLMP